MTAADGSWQAGSSIAQPLLPILTARKQLLSISADIRETRAGISPLAGREARFAETASHTQRQKDTVNENKSAKR